VIAKAFIFIRVGVIRMVIIFVAHEIDTLERLESIELLALSSWFTVNSSLIRIRLRARARARAIFRRRVFISGGLLWLLAHFSAVNVQID
jgi:hypothetical protein